MMKKKSRVQMVYVNAVFSVASQIIQSGLGFIVRRLFIIYLGVEYLGYHSVFQNLLQMLNLVNLGIDVAITGFLYKPLAEEDQSRVAALMQIYKKIYSVIGVCVLVLGIIMSFALPLLIPDAKCSDFQLRMFFYADLTGAVSSYFLAYKRTLLIADQKSYVIAYIDSAMYIVMSCFQIFFLVKRPDFMIYLLVSCGKNIASNVMISLKCKKCYGSFNTGKSNKLIEEYKPQIFSYVKDVFASRIGSYVYYSTDSIIISIFQGSMLVGYLSNYTLVTTQVSNIVGQMFASLQGTFGNFVSMNSDIKKQKKMVDNYLFSGFFIGNFCLLCVVSLIQPFVGIVFGTEYILDMSTALLLAVNVMLTILMQIPSQVFAVHKLYKYDRPIVLTSAGLNIVISVVLVRKWGINGVLIGTFITSLIYLFSRLYIISKKVYFVPFQEYIFKLLKYFIISALSVCIVYMVLRWLAGDSIKSFIVRVLLTGCLSIAVNILLLMPSKEFKYIYNKLFPVNIRRRLSVGVIRVLCILVIMICLIGGVFSEEEYRAEEGNKSLSRKEHYIAEDNSAFPGLVFSLSFDDVIDIFIDLDENHQYKSIFDNHTLKWFKGLHDKWGCSISCYVFVEKDGFNLMECTNRYKEEFEENSDWLRFGFHAWDAGTIYGCNDRDIGADYQYCVKALERIAGKNAIDNVVRLQSFQGDREEISVLSNMEIEPICGLFTADDWRQSYYLSKYDNNYIYCHDYLIRDDMCFFSTDLRVEFIDDFDIKLQEISTDTWNNQRNIMVVFTHEWELSNNDILKNTEIICEWARENGYSFRFLEDEIPHFQTIQCME